ncbi:conidiation-specific protein 6 [Leucogyrophana mollusca]|uniref:Conidiation-specific protein 6 n=1 Tax=Leucogyrophana mollusca TaxID=85980 RepID=A0ACB8B815_9AGAM|nr:conidiation-specific protein 6 [Leucogyrophana mollusca]
MSSNIGNVAGGHKATLKNPNVSEEAKERSQQVLDEMGSKGELPEQRSGSDEGKNLGNVVGGHKVSIIYYQCAVIDFCFKATLKNPNVSEEAKDRSKQVLEDMGA